MPRPREFDETTVLDAAIQCFWAKGYDATSVRDLVDETGLTGASLYNAFGDKQGLYRKALERYVESSIADRILRCRQLPPREAVASFFAEILRRSLTDAQRKGCMLVNAALDTAPRDPALRKSVGGALKRIEDFFRESVAAGQANGTIARAEPAQDIAQHLLGLLMGIRVLARVRPEKALLESIVASALRLLD